MGEYRYAQRGGMVALVGTRNGMRRNRRALCSGHISLMLVRRKQNTKAPSSLFKTKRAAVVAKGKFLFVKTRLRAALPPSALHYRPGRVASTTPCEIQASVSWAWGRNRHAQHGGMVSLVGTGRDGFHAGAPGLRKTVRRLHLSE
jgi:hypothetical protein